jgi:hypothetical protein
MLQTLVIKELKPRPSARDKVLVEDRIRPLKAYTPI